jgi:hypothetical protein
MRPRFHSLVAVCGLAVSPVIAQTVPTYAIDGASQPLPPQVAPHPVNVPAPPDPVTQQKLELLRERIAQRDQLQREIDQLIVETQTPQCMTVHFELLEVNHSAATKLGISPSGPNLTGSFGVRPSWTLDELEKLRKAGVVQTLFAPRVQVLSGEQAKAQIGDLPANSDEEKIDSPYAKLEVRADSLGNNQVQVDFRLDRGTPLEGKETDNGPIPRTQHTTINSRVTSKFGTTETFGGPTIERTRTRRGALGRVTETAVVEHVLLIRVEAVMPHSAGVVPASAIAPR